MKRLSHYDDAGSARMVDVSAKAPTRREARAQAFVRIRPAVLRKLPQNPKGNPLEIARFAGIAAAKKTSELIPLCHPLMLTHSRNVPRAEIAKALILRRRFVVDDRSQKSLMLHHRVVDLASQEIDSAFHRGTRSHVVVLPRCTRRARLRSTIRARPPSLYA